MASSKEGYLWTPSGETVGLVSDGVVSSTPQSTLRDSYDVVVIGAGFAGLVAARNISERTKHSVLLVEGRDRIGGRTWTAKALGEEFEMGGTWIHWNQPHVYAELHRYGLQSIMKTSEGNLDAKANYYTPANASSKEINPEDVGPVIQRVADAFFTIDGLTSRQLMPYPHEPFRSPALWAKYDHLSAKDRLNQLNLPQIEKDIFDSMISSLGSVPGSGCGFVECLRWYALGNHSMENMFELAGLYKLGKGGMSRFARSILSDYRGHLVLNTVIKKIAQTDQSVLLHTQSGHQIRAKYVISTIPHNCLSDIEFQPPVASTKRQAILAGHINQGAKIHFHLAKEEPGWFSTANGYGDSPWCFSFSDHNGTKKKDGTYCIGFGYGGYLKDPRASKEIISSFRKYLKPDAQVKAYLTHDWMNDPLAKGVWSCWGPGGMTKWLRELQQPHGRVLFASADWADGWRGFVDGAIERGGRSAIEVEDLLRSDNPRASL
ncbi:hypothetical protein V2G26_005709 [Clonostachys chloroleuca]